MDGVGGEVKRRLRTSLVDSLRVEIPVVRPSLIHVCDIGLKRDIGSSSGSGVGVSAGFAPIAIGTETDGSIICPSNRAALFGLKPTVGLTSRAGIVPISGTQDSPGPMGRSAWDVAAMLTIIAGFDARDNASENHPPPRKKRSTDESLGSQHSRR